MGTVNKIIGVVYLIIGLYIANHAFDFISPPGFLIAIETWIIFIGAAMVIFGGVKLFLKKPSYA